MHLNSRAFQLLFEYFECMETLLIQFTKRKTKGKTTQRIKSSSMSMKTSKMRNNPVHQNAKPRLGGGIVRGTVDYLE